MKSELSELSGKSLGYTDSCWIVRTVSKCAGKFIDYPDRFWIVPTVSRLSGNLKKTVVQCTRQCALPLRLMPGCCLQPHCVTLGAKLDTALDIRAGCIPIFSTPCINLKFPLIDWAAGET